MVRQKNLTDDIFIFCIYLLNDFIIVISGTGTQFIQWDLGNIVEHTIGTGNVSFTFTGSDPAWLTLKIVQDATGGRTASWPASVKWSNGVAPELSTAANAVDIIYFYFDGLNYYVSYNINNETVFTVATLPTGIQGRRAFVTDSGNTLASHHGQAVSNGGANFVPVYYDGTNWLVG